MTEYTIVINGDGTLNLKQVGDTKEYCGDPDVIYDLMCFMREEYSLDILDSENAYLVSIDGDDMPKAIYHISKGDYDRCNIYNRTIGAFLLLTRALGFVVIHNHPNGVADGSTADIANAALLKSLGNILGIVFKGSYVITRMGFLNVEDKESFELWEEFE